ncbi:CUGBP Elav family member 2 [Dirofilaria immitis]|nr:CUGBP Elav family member 2 [Dirofilaria immitis]
MSNQPIQQSQASSTREPDPDAIKMFVGQIPRSWGEAECRELFEQFGSVCQLNVLRDKVTQASRGCCFVTYYKRADAIAAQAALHNIRVLPQMYHPVQMKPADIENRNERKLFVGMLNKRLTEDDVRDMFSQFGHIEDCTVLKDSEGKSRELLLKSSTRHVILIKSEPCGEIMDSNNGFKLNSSDIFTHMIVCLCHRNKVAYFAQHDSPRDFANKYYVDNDNCCAFVTFAHRSCAQQAIKQVHLSQTMEGCSKPIVVKFADTQKEKDAKKWWNANDSGTFIAEYSQFSQYVTAAACLRGISVFILVNEQLKLISFAQKLLQTAQPNNNTSPALGTQLAALAALLQTASQPNVLSLLGNVLSGLGRLTENTTASNQTSIKSSPFPLVSQQTLASLSSSPGLSNADSSAALQQQQQQQLAALQQQQRLLELLTHQQLANTPISTPSGQNASNSIDALQQAYAGLQQFAGLYPQLSTNNLLTASGASNTGVSNISGGQSKGPDGCNLFIYHLPQDFTDNDLYTTFSPFGSIISAKVFIDKQTNLSKCFGFVSYDNVVSAQNAISALNGFQIGSKRLKVQLKRGKDNKPYPSMPVTSNSGNTKTLST